MGYLTASEATGSVVVPAATDPRHFSAAAGAAKVDPEAGFGSLLMQALDAVNGEQQKAMSMTEELITSPDSVNVHDVTIALASANLSISIAKAVLDRAIRAYQEIIALR